MFSILTPHWDINVAKKVWYEEGRTEGIEEGRKEGEERASKLVLKLISLGKMQEVEEVAKNPELRQKLYLQYGII